MKKTLLAFALLAFVGSASANDGTKPGAKAKAKKADHCTAAAAAKCEKGMAGTDMTGMPACCRAKMAARAAAPTTTAQAAKPVVKTM